MADIPRLNNVIRTLEAGKTVFAAFCQADSEAAIAMSTTKYDGIVFEMEHNPWDIRALRDRMQYLLNRGQIAKSGSIAPAVTPIVRIPPNGDEKNAVPGETGARSRRVWDRVAAYHNRRRSATMPLPRAAIRA